MMGRFMAMVPDIDTFKPVLGTAATYGGGWALPIVCRHLALGRRMVGPRFPLLGTNGVRSGGDVARMALAGASACELLSVVMHEGFAGLTRVIEELDRLLAARAISFAELIGQAADSLQSYQEQAVRPGGWRDVVPPETTAEGC
jgi:dihydroorotate dehydrogenase